MSELHAQKRNDDARPADDCFVPDTGPHGETIISVNPAETPAYTNAAEELVANLVARQDDGANVIRFDISLASREKAALRPRLTCAFVGDSLAACIVTYLDGSGRWGWASSLSVHPAYRRRHIASRIVAAAVADREKEDHTCLALYAYIRVLGQPNYASKKAFFTSRFYTVERVLKPVSALGERGQNFAATATDGLVELELLARTHH